MRDDDSGRVPPTSPGKHFHGLTVKRMDRVGNDDAFRKGFCTVCSLLVASGYLSSSHSKNGFGFTVEAKRWIVERTWAWLDNARSLTRDYEYLPENHEGMVYVVMIRLMLRRLKNNRTKWKGKTS